MTDVHTIRLKHPWTCKPQGDGSLWQRKFNWPAGLTPREVVRLVVESLPPNAQVQLNETVLDRSSDATFNITRLIRPNNKLAIVVSNLPTDDQQSCPFDVRLEIEEG